MKMNDAKKTIFMAHLRSRKDGQTFKKDAAVKQRNG
jgi:hypothetical protein